MGFRHFITTLNMKQIFMKFLTTNKTLFLIVYSAALVNEYLYQEYAWLSY